MLLKQKLLGFIQTTNLGSIKVLNLSLIKGKWHSRRETGKKVKDLEKELRSMTKKAKMDYKDRVES